jgi:hypothetical protein
MEIRPFLSDLQSQWVLFLVRQLAPLFGCPYSWIHLRFLKVGKGAGLLIGIINLPKKQG